MHERIMFAGAVAVPMPMYGIKPSRSNSIGTARILEIDPGRMCRPFNPGGAESTSDSPPQDAGWTGPQACRMPGGHCIYWQRAGQHRRCGLGTIRDAILLPPSTRKERRDR